MPLGRIVSVKNSSDTIGSRTNDLPACSTVPQPTAPPRAITQASTDFISAVQPVIDTLFLRKAISAGDRVGVSSMRVVFFVLV